MNEENKKLAKSYMINSIHNFVEPFYQTVDIDRLVNCTALFLNDVELYFNQDSELWEMAEEAQEEHFSEE